MDFPITITGKHLDVTEPLRAYVTEKVGRACRLLGKITSVDVRISVEKYRQIVEVVIQTHGTTLRAKEETHDMYSSIDLVVEKIEVQAKRLKEKIKDHKHAPVEEPLPAEVEPSAPGRPRVFISESFAAKPMTVDEAVDELQGLPEMFLAFHNARSGQVNVIYKRGDGTFGLVEPPA
jgi:putative sigma-54 modulation protein